MTVGPLYEVSTHRSPSLVSRHAEVVVKLSWWRTRLLPGTLCVALAAVVTLGYALFPHSRSTMRSLVDPRYIAASVDRERNNVAMHYSGAIAQQSPGGLSRQGDVGMGKQMMVANCAKGFVRQGSVCEVGAAMQMILPVASNPTEQRSVRPPERE
jgi:hypothetical protein